MASPNYVVGRGKLYFNQFVPGTKTRTASRYLGNSPELSRSQSEETLDHFSSDYGLKVKDASVSLSNDATGSFKLDDISSENLALWFRGSVDSAVIAGGVVAAYLVSAAVLGSYIQLGVTDADPIGARNVSAVVVKNMTGGGAGVVVAALNNYEVDPVTGRVFLLPTAVAIADGDPLSIGFTAAAGTEEIVIEAGSVIEGRLEFISDNAVGENRDYIWPYVQIRPDGDFALKGDDWQTMDFTLEILKLNDSTDRQYIIKR